jgi:predicted ATPase
MVIEIRKIAIRNFKNLKDVVIYPKKFNVLIGPNGSGKTNFLEFFKLLRKIYVERNPYPFLEWDGYENVVWNHQRSLPIEFEIETVERTTLTEFFKRYWTDRARLESDAEIEIVRKISASIIATQSENVRFLNEIVDVRIPKLDFYYALEKETNAQHYTIILNDKKFKINVPEFRLRHESLFFNILDEINLALSYIDHTELLSRMRDHFGGNVSYITLDRITEEEVFEECKERLKQALLDLNISLICKVESATDSEKVSMISHDISNVIFSIASDTIFIPFLLLYKISTLFPLNLTEIKYKPKIFPIEEPLKERGENALDILAQIQLKEGKLPERVEYFVENYFGGKIYFKGVAPGRMNLYFYKDRVEVSKEHLPDGLLKGLVILTALEQNPSILLIDEIENSLHPELLEFLINTLKEESEGYVFVTTHSPVVLNLVEPEEIYIFKPKDDGSVEIKNVLEYKSKEELMKELEELGISLGEKVLYGFM